MTRAGQVGCCIAEAFWALYSQAPMTFNLCGLGLETSGSLNPGEMMVEADIVVDVMSLEQRTERCPALFRVSRPAASGQLTR